MSVADFTNLRPVFTGHDTSDLRFGQSATPPTAWGYYPASGTGGDVWFGTAYADTVNDFRYPVLGGYAYHGQMHEALHALGLAHGHEATGVAYEAVSAARDSMEYTIMTYRSFVGQTTPGWTVGTWDAPQTPMMLDIQALQHLYGANYGYHAGDTTYRWSPTTGELSIDGAGQGAPGGNKVFMTLWDGGGVDTYDLSNYAVGVKVDLAPGGWSTLAPGHLAYLGYENGEHWAAGCVANAYLFQDNPASLIENAVCGSGNDTLFGNQADNLLSGNAGDDAFWASAGSDTLLGGDGADTAHLGGAWAQYRITAAAGGGFSIIDLRGTEGADAVSGVEWFAFADRLVSAADLLPKSTVGLSTSTPELFEGGAGGLAPFFFTARLDAASQAAQTVRWTVAGSGPHPADASDFAALSGTLTFAAGETSKTFQIPVRGDAAYEPDETFTVTLSDASSGLVIAAASASATILNDDAAPKSTVNLWIAAPGQFEGGAGSTTAFVFTARLDRAVANAQSVHWGVSGGQLAPTDAADFGAKAFPSGTLTFAVGETEKTVVVDVAGDAKVETDETFILTLSDPSSGLLVGQSWALATVLNDDRTAPLPPPIHVNDAQIAAYTAIAERIFHDLIAHGVWHV